MTVCIFVWSMCGFYESLKICIANNKSQSADFVTRKTTTISLDPVSHVSPVSPVAAVDPVVLVAAVPDVDDPVAAIVPLNLDICDSEPLVCLSESSTPQIAQCVGSEIMDPILSSDDSSSGVYQKGFLFCFVYHVVLCGVFCSVFFAVFLKVFLSVF